MKPGRRRRSEVATRYLEAVLLCELDDDFSPFPGGVCGIKNRHLSSFFCEILSDVVERGRSTLSVKNEENKEITGKNIQNVGIEPNWWESFRTS